LLFLVSQSRKSSASRQFHDKSVPVDNFRRPELSSWLLPSEKQQQQNDGNRNNRLRILSNENELFNNRRLATAIG
jgi:hypothetical protein